MQHAPINDPTGLGGISLLAGKKQRISSVLASVIPHMTSKTSARSITHSQIPYAPEQGIEWAVAGNLVRSSRKSSVRDSANVDLGRIESRHGCPKVGPHVETRAPKAPDCPLPTRSVRSQRSGGDGPPLTGSSKPPSDRCLIYRSPIGSSMRRCSLTTEDFLDERTKFPATAQSIPCFFPAKQGNPRQPRIGCGKPLMTGDLISMEKAERVVLVMLGLS